MNSLQLLPKTLRVNHPDCAQFLSNAHLIRPIIGFSQTFGSKTHPFLKDRDGHILIKMRGVWTRWEKIQSILYVDKSTKKCLEKGTKKEWTYISPEGFVPKSRWHYKKPYPVYKLSQLQHKKLLTWARAKPQETCIFQIVTTAHKKSRHPLLNKAAEQLEPNHTSIRLITSDGAVYSAGLQTLERGSTHRLRTIKARITMCDFEEFRHFAKKRVTSIAITDEAAQKVLNRIEYLGKKTIPFNFIQQNCIDLCEDLMLEAGICTPKLKTTLGKMLCASLPELPKHLDKIAKRIQKIWHVICKFLLAKYFLSIGIVALGGTSTQIPLKKPEKRDPWDKKGIKNFYRLVGSWKDFFDPSLNHFTHSGPLIAWQKKQPTTHIETYGETPRMTLYPSSPPSAAS